jgi:hypothetical protein
MNSNKLSSYSTIILVGLCFLIILARIYTYHEPFERDIGVYAVVAHEMLNGRELYSDLWDHKPPAIHATFAIGEILAGYGSQSIFLLNVIAAIISLLGIYFIGSSISKTRSGGLWAAACWTIISSDLMLQANQPNVEVFINNCLIWSFAILIKYEENLDFTKVFTIGILLTLASLYKQITVITAIFFMIAYLLTRSNWLDFKKAIFHSIWITLIGVVIWGSVVLYFIVGGRFEAFYEAVFQYNQHYIKIGAENNLFLSLFNALPFNFSSIIPLFILAVIGLILHLFNNTRHGLYLLAYFLSIPIMVALPNKFYPHYYQLWLPILSAAGGIAIIELGKMFILVNKSWIYFNKLIGGALILSLLSFQIPSFFLSVDEWSYKKYRNVFINSKRIATMLDKLLLPTETFFQFGAEPTLYFYSRRTAPSGILFHYPLLSPMFLEGFSQRVIKDLEQSRPELIVFDSPLEEDMIKHHPLMIWIIQHYHPIPEKLPFALWVRNDGSLITRLAN